MWYDIGFWSLHDKIQRSCVYFSDSVGKNEGSCLSIFRDAPSPPNTYIVTSHNHGMSVQKGDTIRVHYIGELTDGTRFDSSEGRDPP